MLGYLVEEAVQGSPPRLNEVVVEALHHAFHNKLLWEGLETETTEESTISDRKLFHVTPFTHACP